MPPTNPLKLQVLDRIVTVLQAIVAGDNYFYTPHEVNRRFTDPYTATGFPCYSVFPDSGGKIECTGAGADEYTGDFMVNVRGIVSHPTDPGSMLLKCHRDVCKAIDADSLSGAAGSLGVLGIETRIEDMPETDDGALSLDGFGYFYQRIRCSIAGSYGEL